MPMSEPDVMTIVYRMTKRYPWINYCVSVCTLADVPEAFDISHVFVREAERLDEAMTSTTQGMMIIIRLKVPFGLSALALYITATTVACQEQARNPLVEHTVNLAYSGSRPSYMMLSSLQTCPQFRIGIDHFFVASNVDRYNAFKRGRIAWKYTSLAVQLSVGSIQTLNRIGRAIPTS